MPKAKKARRDSTVPVDVPMFEVGQMVFAKMKGYPPWPAKVMNLPVNSEAVAPALIKYQVFFYGTHDKAAIKGQDLVLFDLLKDSLKGMAKKSLVEAIKEAEEKPEVSDLSLKVEDEDSDDSSQMEVEVKAEPEGSKLEEVTKPRPPRRKSQAAENVPDVLESQANNDILSPLQRAISFALFNLTAAKIFEEDATNDEDVLKHLDQIISSLESERNIEAADALEMLRIASHCHSSQLWSLLGKVEKLVVEQDVCTLNLKQFLEDDGFLLDQSKSEKLHQELVNDNFKKSNHNIMFDSFEELDCSLPFVHKSFKFMEKKANGNFIKYYPLEVLELMASLKKKPPHFRKILSLLEQTGKPLPEVDYLNSEKRLRLLETEHKMAQLCDEIKPMLGKTDFCERILTNLALLRDLDLTSVMCYKNPKSVQTIIQLFNSEKNYGELTEKIREMAKSVLEKITLQIAPDMEISGPNCEDLLKEVRLGHRVLVKASEANADLFCQLTGEPIGLSITEEERQCIDDLMLEYKKRSSYKLMKAMISAQAGRYCFSYVV